jgi:hypothetical protein
MYTGWTEDNIEAAYEIRHRRGRNSKYRPASNPNLLPQETVKEVQEIEWAGSGNYQIVAPAIQLAGRGIGVALSLVYNAQLWTLSVYQGSATVSYDIDLGWPAPGWFLGFGRLLTLNAVSYTHLTLPTTPYV